MVYTGLALFVRSGKFLSHHEIVCELVYEIKFSVLYVPSLYQFLSMSFSCYHVM